MQKKKYFISWEGEVHRPIFPDFATFGIVCNQSSSKWPTMANLAIEVAQIGLKWQILVNFQLFPSFPTKAAQMDSKRPISPNLHLLQSFPTKAAHFWPNFKKILSVGGTSANFLRFCNFSNCLQLKWLKMTHNGQYCHRSGLDWLKIANFG